MNQTFLSSEDNITKRAKMNNVIESLSNFVSCTTNDVTKQNYNTLEYCGEIYCGQKIKGSGIPSTTNTPIIYNGVYLGTIDSNGVLEVTNTKNTNTTITSTHSFTMSASSKGISASCCRNCGFETVYCDCNNPVTRVLCTCTGVNEDGCCFTCTCLETKWQSFACGIFPNSCCMHGGQYDCQRLVCTVFDVDSSNCKIYAGICWIPTSSAVCNREVRCIVAYTSDNKISVCMSCCIDSTEEFLIPSCYDKSMSYIISPAWARIGCRLDRSEGGVAACFYTCHTLVSCVCTVEGEALSNVDLKMEYV